MKMILVVGGCRYLDAILSVPPMSSLDPSGAVLSANDSW
jgi:hypothetical protein